jgi:para-aminobenzoate synthetase/4-amino-4-deoxychorismate lyase
MAASADYFAVPFDRDRAEKEVLAACAAVLEPRRVRVVLLREGTLTVSLSDLPSRTSASVRLGLATDPMDSRDVRLFHKTVDRARYECVRAGRPDVDDVVFYNERGEVTETTIANLAIRLEGCWWTPPIGCGLLPGVERERLIETGQLGERRVSISDLRHAEGLAVINSLRGWRPAALVD